MDLRVQPFDHPDAVKLIEEVQQEYVQRYGDFDRTPTDPAQFALPRGLFVVGYLDGVPVACGGWRAHEDPPDGLRAGDAEIKRMYVQESVRGRGFARGVLAELERTARAAGHTRTVLETGLKQPEAIALYTSSGYTAIPKFGYYRDDALSLCFGKDLVEKGN
ncbi:GNAT family N-acetyltransferase [Amycolatopsis cynarae]|uniref:GNAT family N-acetyltransferase n=1 Tax=Amycolatopsis cynarae TaxID=2995223 RepID=A0ABY7AZ09_9PSEU|nr:GNAT family N-acetyltransferase [Amycolatopsis sp. HUAS 11-8]WAL64273.1 GNAT family N-acetyltransferase [Amycolatopsis sp. HUAS 11-8]